MTNTLHRKGAPEALKNDFVLFATPTRSISAELPDKMKRFTEICLKHKPVNRSVKKEKRFLRILKR